LRYVYYRTPGTRYYQQQKWTLDVYHGHAQQQRRAMFLSIARFCNINRPIPGYYFEFGCHSANTIRIAYDTFHYLFDWTYVAFDSFQGLPPIGDVDQQEIWRAGNLKTTEEVFRRICHDHGIPRDKLITVSGFFDQSLTDDVKRRLTPTKAAVIYVDCDLYESTVPVPNFIDTFLQPAR
jgi:hypothetical protein